MNSIWAFVKRYQFTRFIIGGIPSVLLYIGISYICIEVLDMWYVYGFAIAQLANSALNFVIQKQWVFVDKSKYGLRQVILYISISCLYQCIAMSLSYVIEEVFEVPLYWVPVIAVAPKTLIAFFIVRPIFTSLKK